MKEDFFPAIAVYSDPYDEKKVDDHPEGDDYPLGNLEAIKGHGADHQGQVHHREVELPEGKGL